MKVLTIESSCDETSAAVVEDGRRVRSNVVASQIELHSEYGGVVPEIASRNHIMDLHPVIERALDEGGASLDDIDGFGVTSGPGLVGSLIVGVEAIKGFAYALNRPFVGLNHLEGHLTAPLLDLEEFSPPDYPYIGLVASGGHSDLYIVDGLGEYRLLGRTRDDAAGEAFDKVAQMVGLPYPGGVEIDRLAADGDSEAIEFPRPMMHHDSYDFSFAGLKTAVRNYLHQNGVPEGSGLRDFCASFQRAIIDVLLHKSFEAADAYDIPRIVLSGGVACNSELRGEAKRRAERHSIEVFPVPPRLCTDNAAMLGPIAEFYLRRDATMGYDHRVSANRDVVLSD